LADLIRDEKLPIDPEAYVDIDELRTDIREYEEDPESFLRNKSRKDIRRQEERAFREMNGITETLPPEKSEKSAKPVKAGIQDL
jgi:uncharacterized coiled-coil DUF342 family protein